MAKDCPECGKWRERGAKFCYVCGNDLRTRKHTPDYTFFHWCILIAVGLVSFIIAINTLSIIIHFNSICDSLSNFKIGVTISAGLWDYTLFWVSGTGLPIMLAAYTACEALCLAYALRRFSSKLKDEKNTGIPELTEKSGMGAASACLCASLLLSIVYILLTTLGGSPIDGSWIDEYTNDQLAFMLTRAGVREEILFRVLWIGVPLMIVAAAVNHDKRSWQHLFGGSGMNRTAFLLILISSFLFGLAHNESWGIAKVLDAVIGGIIFGYLYVEYGLYASIIAHTANDTMLSIAWIGLGEGLMVLVELCLIIIGLIILIYWALKRDFSPVDFRKMNNFPDKLENRLNEQWGRH